MSIFNHRLFPKFTTLPQYCVARCACTRPYIILCATCALSSVGLLRFWKKPKDSQQAGFTLLEVLVALVIVGTALGASLRAVGSLAQNGSSLRGAMMAGWSAENRMAQIRLGREWPAIGNSVFECAQGDLPLYCEERVSGTANPYFRRVEVMVYAHAHDERRIFTLTQVVPNAR